ncbi:murein transglycosylase [Fusarium oxysporum f. sp. lycopersici 4287]|uniref:Murein transglycosylase n=3 Tax=Fusarium oxysporum TaxID=5507 RepID=A0A0J9V8F1_FUSO4|nr:murein transglycosylase [Fusarium oxysporum f. sp. lycopersici 4287]EXK32348.1 murein transglycosylase [Fusarium oxysporum f. sp. melonis 26406]KNB07435.1 murein transglycosylase [Fusarium oxysporum f. sp. lycopersici 4287]
MRLINLSAALLGALSAPSMVAGKQHGHRHNGFEHLRQHLPVQSSTLEKRGGQCQFPTDDPNMVAVTPDAKNAGWAMSPDQECKPGSYCPFACKPGMVMNQWDPDSTYEYPASMNGGLFCNKNGEIEKPFEGKPNCVSGTGSIEAVNKCGSKMSWCQTVLPGNEAMLIPTLVTSSATLAVPGSSYWCSTAAHFYINPPGTGEEGCIWGTESEPIGNWSPYVAGANTESNGQTFVKIGWNPIWEDSALKSKLPDFGVEIQCPDGGCNGLPCRIDPAKGEGNVGSSLSAKGAGGAAFCVVTVQKGSTAQIVAFSSGKGSSGGDDDDDEEAESSTAEAEPSTTAEAKVTTSEEPVVSTTKEPSTTAEPTTSALPTTTSSTSTTTTSVETTSSAETSSTTEQETSSDTTTEEPTSTIFTSATSKTTKHKSTKKVYPTVKPGIFRENGTSTYSSSESEETAAATEVDSGAAPTQSKENEAGRHQGNTAVAGLVVAFIAAACFF